MSWQAALLGLVKKYGSAARFAASTVLGAVLPGSPAVIGLIGDAIDMARDQALLNWEEGLMASAKVSAEELERLGCVVEILTGELDILVAQVAELEGCPRRPSASYAYHFPPMPVCKRLYPAWRIWPAVSMFWPCKIASCWPGRRKCCP